MSSVNAKVKESIDLLHFALVRKKINVNDFYIGFKDDVYRGYEQLCLQQEKDDSWIVFYSGMGNNKLMAKFFNYRDAIDYFYWSLVQEPSCWQYRDEWEKSRNSTASSGHTP
jgi:hypothetical protein